MATPNALVSSKPLRWAYLAFGLGCTGIGILDLFIPGMPSTVFFLIALWAFKRSSPRLESWLLYHPWFGQGLRDWNESRTMTMRTKVYAVSMVWLGIGLSILLVHRPWVKVLLGLVILALTAFLLSRKTKR